MTDMNTTNDLRPNKKLMQSYVYYNDDAFFVSTIERDFSTIGGLVRGEETIVWELDPETNERGDIILQAGSITEHLDICKQLALNGVYEEKN